MNAEETISKQLEAILSTKPLTGDKLVVTLQGIKDEDPCTSGWRTLVRALGPDFPMDAPIPVGRIVETNNLDDAIWSLRAVKSDVALRLFAADCAELVLPFFENEYPDDLRPRQVIKAARKFAVGEISENELLAAESAARSAAESAARSAAWSAAESAAWSAARSAAWSAAWSAAESAAKSAAKSAARSAAWSAARSAIQRVMEKYQ